MLIGIAGRAGAGKDTTAAHLVDRHGFIQAAFADPLREEIAQAYGLQASNPMFHDRLQKETPTGRLALAECLNPMFIACALSAAKPDSRISDEEMARPRSPRWVMQYWGTEFRRGQLADYWVRMMEHRLRENLRRKKRVVVSDVRFDDEAALIRKLGGIVLHLHRPGSVVATAHSSESGVREDLDRDWTAINDGTIEQLLSRMDQIIFTLEKVA